MVKIVHQEPVTNRPIRKLLFRLPIISNLTITEMSVQNSWKSLKKY